MCGEPGIASVTTKKKDWTETSEASQEEEEEEEGEGEKTEGEEGGAREGEGEGLRPPHAKRLAQGTPSTGHLRWTCEHLVYYSKIINSPIHIHTSTLNHFIRAWKNCFT